MEDVPPLAPTYNLSVHLCKYAVYDVIFCSRQNEKREPEIDSKIHI